MQACLHASKRNVVIFLVVRLRNNTIWERLVFFASVGGNHLGNKIIRKRDLGAALQLRFGLFLCFLPDEEGFKGVDSG